MASSGLKNKNKSGSMFEELIAWIQTCLHKNATIKANEKIKDIDTGKPRQVDITIRLSDGPTEFLGIVEVRDRRRPVGVRYVEEILGKIRSTQADAAFLVSRSGFTKTAMDKARHLGIRILTFEEAKTEDWSGWLECRTFGVVQLKYQNPVVTLFEYETDKVIIPSKRIIDILKNNPNAKIIDDENGTHTVSLHDLIYKIVNTFTKQVRKNIPLDGTRVRIKLLFKGHFEPDLWMECDTGIKGQVGNVLIELESYNEIKEFPLKLMRYRFPNSDESIAEIAASDVEILGKKYRIEIIAPGAGRNIPAGTTVSMRTIKLNNDIKIINSPRSQEGPWER